MAKRTFVHVGPPKTGSSYLQMIWRAHKDDLATQGLLYPGTRPNEHFHAYVVATQNATYLKRLNEHGLGTWDRFTQEIEAWPGDALLSCESFARVESPRVADVVKRLNEVSDEVHVIITGRDIGRQVLASWQQAVKIGSPKTFERFWTGMRTAVDRPPNTFWRGHDLARLARRWGEVLPAGHVHLVVHGPRGTAPDRLWHQICQVTGVEPGSLGEMRTVNQSLGAAEIELLRRMHSTMPKKRDRFTLGALSSKFLTNRMRDLDVPSQRLRISPEAEAWAVERSEVMVAELRTLDLDVVGDLDDLIVRPDPSARGQMPHEVTDGEVSEVAAALLGHLLVHEAESRQAKTELKRENAELRERLLLAERPGLPRRAVRSARRRLSAGLRRS